MSILERDSQIEALQNECLAHAEESFQLATEAKNKLNETLGRFDTELTTHEFEMVQLLRDVLRKKFSDGILGQLSLLEKDLFSEASTQAMDIFSGSEVDINEINKVLKFVAKATSLSYLTLGLSDITFKLNTDIDYINSYDPASNVIFMDKSDIEGYVKKLEKFYDNEDMVREISNWVGSLSFMIFLHNSYPNTTFPGVYGYQMHNNYSEILYHSLRSQWLSHLIGYYDQDIYALDEDNLDLDLFPFRKFIF